MYDFPDYKGRNQKSRNIVKGNNIAKVDTFQGIFNDNFTRFSRFIAILIVFEIIFFLIKSSFLNGF